MVKMENQNETNLYRIFYSDGNNRDELGRVSAKDIDQAVEYAVKQYFKPDLEFEEDSGDDEHLYLRIDSCKYCDKQEIMEINDIEDEEKLCEYCEVSEYIEIMLDEEAEPEFKTIYGVNEYANLENGQLPYDYNPLLAKSWEQSPEKGIAALILTTIEENPELEQGFSTELIEKSKETLKQ